MRRAANSGAAVLFFLGIAMPIGAQRTNSSGGTTRVSDRVEVTYRQRRTESSSGDVAWMRFIVLWRGQPGWRMTRPGTTNPGQAESERAFREASAAATLAEHSFMGLPGGTAPFWAEVDRDNTTLFVLGNQYAIPQHDSTLIVLIDRADRVGGPAHVVGSAVIDGRMSPDLVPRMWTSGDTTTLVRPAKSGIEVFLESLKRDPAVAAFLQ